MSTIELPGALRLRRLELGLSQDEVARRAGLCRSHLSDLEALHHRPRYRTAQALSVALDCEPDCIFPDAGQASGEASREALRSLLRRLERESADDAADQRTGA